MKTGRVTPQLICLLVFWKLERTCKTKWHLTWSAYMIYCHFFFFFFLNRKCIMAWTVQMHCVTQVSERSSAWETLHLFSCLWKAIINRQGGEGFALAAGRYCVDSPNGIHHRCTLPLWASLAKTNNITVHWVQLNKNKSRELLGSRRPTESGIEAFNVLYTVVAFFRRSRQMQQ